MTTMQDLQAAGWQVDVALTLEDGVDVWHLSRAGQNCYLRADDDELPAALIEATP